MIKSPLFLRDNDHIEVKTINSNEYLNKSKYDDDDFIYNEYPFLV
jgi:hypothetical protein